MSKYRLKKGLPAIPITEEKTIDEWVKVFPYMWGKDFENYKDFFEEIKEPERITVDFYLESKPSMYIAEVSQPIPPEKLPAIEQAIENVLNGPIPSAVDVLDGKISFKKTDSASYDGTPLSRFLQDEIGVWENRGPLKFAQPKKYTEKDMQDCFKAARWVDTQKVIGEIEMSDGDRADLYANQYENFKDYLQSLNK